MTSLTIGQTVAGAARRFTAAGLDTARLDARLLLAHALGRDTAPPGMADEELVGAVTARAFERLCQARLTGVPVSRLIGHRDFWRDRFMIDSHGLDPRPDSETLVEQALAWAAQSGRHGRHMRILDLGTGSGCLLLSLLRELPLSTGVGIDLSAGACRLARRNGEALGLNGRCDFAVGDWLAAISGRFDLVVCNPPYIPSGDIARLDREVREHEPRRALDGGADGLAAYRSLLPGLASVVSSGGCVLLEIGMGQADVVATMAMGFGFVAEAHNDLAGIVRCLRLEANKAGDGGGVPVN
ncbi:MAG: peptide chain release factor N(5)-glutamine methyltransferase [Alphaproteobacteria bacterium]